LPFRVSFAAEHAAHVVFFRACRQRVHCFF
jgi:hypothetical protein